MTALPGIGPLRTPWVRDAVLILGAVVALSLLAQLSITVPFSTARSGELVPITGQTFGVLLVAVTYGARRAVSAVAIYLAVGFAGAPVYAGGLAGAALLTGATAGYLWGFLLAALVVGWFADHGVDRGPWLYAVLALGNALVYVVGLPVLALWLDRHSAPVSVWDAGLWPFVAGDLAKLFAAATLVPAAWAIAGRTRRPDR